MTNARLVRIQKTKTSSVSDILLRYISYDISYYLILDIIFQHYTILILIIPHSDISYYLILDIIFQHYTILILIIPHSKK